MEFEPLLASGCVELLDNKKLFAQLKGLERRTRSSGRDSVDHGPGLGMRDDICNAACGAIVAARGQKATERRIIWLGEESTPDGLKDWEAEWLRRLNEDRQPEPEDPQVLAMNNEPLIVKVAAYLGSAEKSIISQ